MNPSLQISIVCENEIRREGLRKILEEREFFVDRVVQSHLDLEPFDVDNDIIALVIVEAPNDRRSLEVCHEIHSLSCNVRIVILGRDTNSHLVAEAFQAGADGYVSQDISCACLVEMLKLIALGEKLVPSQVVFDLASMVDRGAERDTSLQLHEVNLTDREVDTLCGLIRGEPNKIISRGLGITEATVKVHVKSILRKLNVMNRTQAAIWGMSRGLTGTEQPTSNGGSPPAIVNGVIPSPSSSGLDAALLEPLNGVSSYGLGTLTHREGSDDHRGRHH